MPSNATKEQRSLLKSAGLMSLITLLSRFTGLAREVTVAHFLGTGMAADAFAIAFKLPNLFRRLVGEGAMSSAFIPVLVDLQGDDKETLKRVCASFFTLMAMLVAVLCAVCVLGANFLVSEVFARGYQNDPAKLALTVLLTRWMFFYLLFISLAAVVQAILNSHKIFGPSAFTPVLLNLITVGAAFGLGQHVMEPHKALAIGVMVGGFVQLAFQLPFVWRLGIPLWPHFDFRHPAIKKVFLLMVPGLAGAGLYQLNIWVSQMIATFIPNNGAVASLGYSNRLLEFTLGVFIVALSTAVLPTFSAQVRDRQLDKLQETLSFALRMTAYVTIPSMIGLFLIRYPLIRLLFKSGQFDENSVSMTVTAFNFHITGLLFIGLTRILVPAFFSFKDMKTPVYASALAMLINAGTCIALVGPLAQGGIALANSISVAIQTLALILFFRRKIGGLPWGNLFWGFAKITLAAAVMGLIGWQINQMWPESFLERRWHQGLLVFTQVVTCALSFMALSWLLRLEEFATLWSLLTRRFRRGRGA